MSAPFRIVKATVAETLPLTGSVIVSTPGEPNRCALVGSRTGNVGSGTKECAGLLPGVSVMCAFSEDDTSDNYVISALPDIVSSLTRSPLDMLELGGGSTAFTEALFKKLLSDQGKQFSSASYGMPADLMPGEWAMLNDVGGGIAVERFAAWLRASEFCGVAADALTETLRVTARHRVDMSLTEESHNAIYAGVPVRTSFRALYSSEAFGLEGGNAADAEEKAFRTSGATPPVGDAPGDPTKLSIEPLGEVMAARVVDVESSSINGTQTNVVVPVFVEKKATSAFDVLSRMHRFCNGSIVVESVQSLHFKKVAIIPGLAINTPDGTLSGEPPVDPFVISDEATHGLGQAILAYELHAFLSNVASGGPSASRANTTEAPDPKKQWLKTGEVFTLQVNPGKALTKFYGVSAGIDVMPDGSVVITDAWGSQVIMAGGNIVISAPGDIYRLPGRNDVVLAPGDVIARARKDVELSSSSGDIRVKAERNLSVLGGNSGTGGVIIESKGINREPTTTPGKDAINAGVVIKSASDVLVAADGDIETRSVSGTVITRAAEVLTDVSGNVVLNAPQIIIYTSKDSHYVFNGGLMSVPGQLSVGGALLVAEQSFMSKLVHIGQDGMVITGHVQATGSIFAGGAVAGRSVTPHKDTIKDDVAPVAKAARKGIADAEKTAVKTGDDTVKRYADGSAKRFSADVVKKVQLSFKLDGEYEGTRGQGGVFTLPAAMWQIRLGQGTSPWLEPVVAGETAPYPGREAWTSGMLVLVEPMYYDPVSGYIHPDSAENESQDPPTVATRDVPLTAYIAPS